MPQVVQGKTGEAETLRDIRQFRATHAPDPSSTLSKARRDQPAAFERLVAFVE